MNFVASSRLAPPRHVHAVRQSLSRLRVQLPAAVLFAVVLPIAIGHKFEWDLFTRSASGVNTLIGSLAAVLAGLFLFRRVVGFPGVRAFSYVMPAFGSAYGVVLAIFFFGRFDYSRLSYALSFAAALAAFFFLCIAARRGVIRLYLVPGGSVEGIGQIANVEAIPLTNPARIPANAAPLVADLRADLADSWQRVIARATLAGIPVYHAKQVSESLTGRVEIDHLSENSFGSLLPNLNYRRTKRLLDLTTALLMLPILILPFAIVALAIKLDSHGPIFFRQLRMGYRGRSYHVLKFRTMIDRPTGSDAEREDAITLADDPRITRVGKILRRTRIDELPQLWNVVLGQMSWIGPRPEAMELSAWYEAELPFYSYRHIIRPGITGWAQVNQGHVAGLSEVHEKLHYDFYYIKNFSGWLDWLIVFRTIGIMLSGFGSK